MCHFLVDPDDMYAYEQEQGSKDDLDFRHHNYKEMRKVREKPVMSNFASRKAQTLNSLQIYSVF